MNKVRKLRSKNYKQVIEIQVPVRFYWATEGYDGFEFGPLDGCSRNQLRLLDKVTDQLFFDQQCANVAKYMRENHKEEWRALLDRIEAEVSNIPQTFFDAFKEGGNED